MNYLQRLMNLAEAPSNAPVNSTPSIVVGLSPIMGLDQRLTLNPYLVSSTDENIAELNELGAPSPIDNTFSEQSLRIDEFAHNDVDSGSPHQQPEFFHVQSSEFDSHRGQSKETHHSNAVDQAVEPTSTSAAFSTIEETPVQATGLERSSDAVQSLRNATDVSTPGFAPNEPKHSNLKPLAPAIEHALETDINAQAKAALNQQPDGVAKHIAWPIADDAFTPLDNTQEPEPLASQASTEQAAMLQSIQNAVRTSAEPLDHALEPALSEQTSPLAHRHSMPEDEIAVQEQRAAAAAAQTSKPPVERVIERVEKATPKNKALPSSAEAASVIGPLKNREQGVLEFQLGL